MEALDIKELTWMDLAQCRGMDSVIFFPPYTVEEGRPPGRDQYKAARLICGICPVKQQCLDFVVHCVGNSHIDEHGMWGGMTPTERRKYKSKLRRAAGIPRSRILP